jgi:hypothetical protein
VGQSEISSGAVHTSELDTSSQTLSFAANAGGSAATDYDKQIISGGQYSFWMNTEITLETAATSTTICYWAANGDSSGTDGSLANYVSMCVVNVGGLNSQYEGDARSRYVNSSAPWDMGHGEIALFIYLRVDSEGKITGANVAESPPWGYNGKTSLVPDRVAKFKDKKGKTISTKKYKKIISPDAEIIVPPWKGGDPAKWDIEKYLNPEMVDVEIDQKLKNADMGDIPHPFSTLREGNTVVLIDPNSKIIGELSELHRKGENICQLFKKGYVQIGEEVSGYASLAGVSIRKANWKN